MAILQSRGNKHSLYTLPICPSFTVRFIKMFPFVCKPRGRMTVILTKYKIFRNLSFQPNLRNLWPVRIFLRSLTEGHLYYMYCMCEVVTSKNRFFRFTEHLLHKIFSIKVFKCRNLELLSLNPYYQVVNG